MSTSKDPKASKVGNPAAVSAAGNPAMSGAGNPATLITSPAASSMTAVEAQMMDGCNLLHEAVAQGDAARAAAITADLFELLRQYEGTDADSHPDPLWAVPHQRALVFSAAGRTEEAVHYEKKALEHARTGRQREISLGNLAERLMRLGKNQESIEYFLLAQEVAPSSVPILLTGAQALYFAGYKGEADKIFKALGRMPEQLRQGTELTAYLEFEGRLHAMAKELPALAGLMQRWDELRLSEEASHA